MYTIKDFLNGQIAVVVHAQWQWNDFIDLCEKYGASFGGTISAREWLHDFAHKPEIIVCEGGKRLLWGFANKKLKQVGRYKVHVNELLCPAVQESGRILHEVLPNGFPEPDPQAVNCRCYVETGKPPEQPRRKIVIESRGVYTFAYMYVDDELVKTRMARCNPADKFSLRIGAQTAFNRLWEKKKKKEQ